MCAFGYSMCITCNVQYVLYCTYSDYQYILLTVRFTLHKLTCVHSVTACALHVMYNTFYIVRYKYGIIYWFHTRWQYTLYITVRYAALRYSCMLFYSVSSSGGEDEESQQSIGMGSRTHHSWDTPYVSASATNIPCVSPSVGWLK